MASKDGEAAIDPDRLCEHGQEYHRFEMDQTADEIIDRLWCEHCGAEQVERREPETMVEHLRCESQALQDLGELLLEDVRAAVQRACSTLRVRERDRDD